MTPEERALRDAWLSECWAPVRQWHVGAAPQPVCKGCGKAMERRSGRGAPRQYCAVCRPKKVGIKDAA